MATNTLNAASNPGLANDLISKATAEPVQTVQPAHINPPSETLVDLPGGYITDAGEVIKVAEVRELNGRDEEAISKAPFNRMFTTILNRAVVSIGSERATEELLDSMFVGDRDALMLGIYRATFGPTATLSSFCAGCEDYKSVQIDISKDIKSKILVDPLEQRRFTVQGKGKEFVVTLPTGKLQKKLLASELTTAEQITTLLEGTIEEIDGMSVLSKFQIQNLGVMDRRVIAEELTKRAFGPQFDDLTVTCPDCSGEVAVPISLGALFQF